MTEIELNKIIGKNVKKYRLLYNVNISKMTQKDLAKKIGVGISTIGNLESPNVTQGISIYNLYKISKTLDVPINKFFE